MNLNALISSAIVLGYWCPLGTQYLTQYPCPAGSWSNLTNLIVESDCYVCPKGWFCLKGASSPTGICPTGHYCPSGNLLNKTLIYINIYILKL